MITVSIGGKEIVVKPKHLLDYVEKVDFIKMRRGTPWDLIQGFPPEIANHEENYKTLVGLAIKQVYTNSSSVGIEEEVLFDKSEEGFFWMLWKCMPPIKARVEDAKGNKKSRMETWREGINRAKALWESGTNEEKFKVRLALEATDESHNLKNSDGPSDQ
jgi:hypothetical protein